MFRMSLSLSLSRWNWKLIPRNEAAGSESMKIIREENDPVLVFVFVYIVFVFISCFRYDSFASKIFN